ncbi:hypothetical protein ACWJJH_20985 [Endozoicomonadaceae bacterium StTr2]
MRKPEKKHQMPGKALFFFILLAGLGLLSIAEAQDAQARQRITILFAEDSLEAINAQPQKYIQQISELTGHPEVMVEDKLPFGWVISFTLKTDETLSDLATSLTEADFIRSAEPDNPMYLQSLPITIQNN